MMETFAALLLALAASELLDPCRGGRAEVPGLWVLRSVLFLALAMLCLGTWHPVILGLAAGHLALRLARRLAPKGRLWPFMAENGLLLAGILGTAILLMGGGAVLMFLAGVHILYFIVVGGAGVGLVAAVFTSRGTPWQLLQDYQYRRIDTFLDPASDPLGAGYHITQSKIALGSGGWTGRGFMQGTQSRLNFLPEKHTDFIFTTLAEEFGFIGGISLLALYVLIIVFCIHTALATRDRYSSLITLGVAITFFLFFSVNMSMVMGLAPVVGVPLPMVSYGGSAMLVLMVGFGLVQSAHIHRPR